MTTTTTELPALLRGAVTWRSGRAFVDNDYMSVVADWCDDEGFGPPQTWWTPG
jgi:hypothetical protein